MSRILVFENTDIWLRSFADVFRIAIIVGM